MSTHAFAPTFDLTNPFLAEPRAQYGEETTELSEPCYALVKTGPDVHPDEVESHVDAVEVRVRWGNQILSVAHLAKDKSFWVGAGADLALPDDVVGSERAPIVLRRGEATFVIVPQGATGHVSGRGETQAIETLVRSGSLATSNEIPAAHEIMLADGMSVTMDVGGVTFEVSTVRAGKVAPIGFLAQLIGGATGFIGLSLLGHAAIVASMAMFMPKMGPDDSEALDRDQLLLMQKFLNASAERDPEKQPDIAGPSDEPTGGGSTGAPHHGESGASGTTKPVTTNGRMSFKGADHESALSRKELLDLAANGGFVGIINASTANDPNAPASPWAKEFKGSDEKSAWGKMFGQSIDDAAGFGVGLWGTGEGGGGQADVIGLDHVNTIGGGGGIHGIGIGKGDRDGIGNGHAPGMGGHIPKAPPLREKPITTVGGHLPAEVIQRIVRQNFGRFRLCYENGLRTNPKLAGQVTEQSISLSGTQVSDLSPLANLRELKIVFLTETPVTNLAPLANLTKLEHLALSLTAVSDVTPLARLPRLKMLILSGTAVSDVTPLSGLASLDKLILQGAPVQDISPLHKLTNLRIVDLRGTEVSDEKVVRFRQALPNCQILASRGSH